MVSGAYVRTPASAQHLMLTLNATTLAQHTTQIALYNDALARTGLSCFVRK